MAAKPLEGKHESGSSINSLSNQFLKINLNNEKPVEIEGIPTWLRNFESPFIWHSQLQRALSTEHIIERCLEKLEELSLDETEFSIRRYTVLLKLVVEYAISKNQQQVQDSMKIIRSCIKRDSTKGSSQYEKLKTLLDHVVSATDAHLLALNGQEAESREIAGEIMPIKEMPNYCQAGLYAMKANFILYSGYENGENIAVEMVRKCLELEPDYHEWMYLLSKMLRQQRKDIPFNDEIPREELILLEKAVKLERSSKYLNYLGQIYRECASQAHKKYRNNEDYFKSNLFKTTQDMNEKALDYYKQSLEINPDNPANLRRIGYGIMNLPKRIADYDLALKCLLKSLSLCENMNTLHIIGTFYHRYGKDNKKALEYYERTAKAECHAGLSDFIRVKFIEDPEYNPCEDLESGLKWDTKKKNRMFLLTQLGGYHLFIKRDFLKSIDYFNKVIIEDKDTNQMTVFKSIFLRMYETINLYQYLANEALLYLNQKTSSSDDEKVYEVMALMDTITNIHPELQEIDPDPFLIPKLCEKSQDIINKEKNERDMHHNHRMQPNFARGHRGRGGGSLYRSRNETKNYEVRRKSNNRNPEQSHDNSEQDRKESSSSRRSRNQDQSQDNSEHNRTESFPNRRGISQNNQEQPRDNFEHDRTERFYNRRGINQDRREQSKHSFEHDRTESFHNRRGISQNNREQPRDNFEHDRTEGFHNRRGISQNNREQSQDNSELDRTESVNRRWGGNQTNRRQLRDNSQQDRTDSFYSWRGENQNEKSKRRPHNMSEGDKDSTPNWRIRK